MDSNDQHKLSITIKCYFCLDSVWTYWRATQTLFFCSKTSPHKLPWNLSARDNYAPYYSKPCCSYVNERKLLPDERLKPTEWMTVPWVPLKEGEIHFSWLWLHFVPWVITRQKLRSCHHNNPMLTEAHMCLNKQHSYIMSIVRECGICTPQSLPRVK